MPRHMKFSTKITLVWTKKALFFKSDSTQNARCSKSQVIVITKYHSFGHRTRLFGAGWRVPFPLGSHSQMVTRRCPTLYVNLCTWKVVYLQVLFCSKMKRIRDTYYVPTYLCVYFDGEFSPFSTCFYARQSHAKGKSFRCFHATGTDFARLPYTRTIATYIKRLFFLKSLLYRYLESTRFTTLIRM